MREDGARAAVTGGNYLSGLPPRARRRVLRSCAPPATCWKLCRLSLRYASVRPQPDAMRQMWGLLRREGILDRRRDRYNAFSPVGSNGLRPLAASARFGTPPLPRLARYTP